MIVPTKIKPVTDAIITHGGTPCIVGGAVRDFVMGKIPKDFDVEVFDLMQDELISILEQFGQVDIVGKSFGVIKLNIDGEIFDFSTPRKDNKVDVGHTGFEISLDPFMSFADSAKRRDLTMNALIYDIKNDDIIDPFGGLTDIHNGIIRHIIDSLGKTHFHEDPLRILRVFQFAARFDMDTSLALQWIGQVELFDSFGELSKDRIWHEWQKWAEKSTKPSKGLNFLWQCTWSKHFPEIEELAYTEQDPKHHEEGNVFKHTMLVCDAMAGLCDTLDIQGDRRVILMLAALCHDFGKPATTTYTEGKGITAYGHDVAGEAPTRSFLIRINCPKDFIDSIVALVVNHMQAVYYIHMTKEANCNQKTKEKFIRRLSTKVSIEDFALITEADNIGRITAKSNRLDVLAEMLEIARNLSVINTKPVSFVTGKLLIEHGYAPGVEMGKIIKAGYEAQLDGEINNVDDAISWIKAL